MAAAEALTVSIVVPTYQRRDRLPALVDAILGDSSVDEAVIVVDGSTDGSIEYLRDRAREDSRLLPLTTPNRGAASARQAGAERASGQVILLLDDDVLPAPGLAGGHARRHAERDGLVVLGYMPVVTPGGSEERAVTADLYAEDYERACRQYEDEPESVLTGLWAGNVSLRRDE